MDLDKNVNKLLERYKKSLNLMDNLNVHSMYV
jgi:hypothetical protein